MEYYSDIKNNELLTFAMMWMELESIMLSKVRERQIPYECTYYVEFNKQNKGS